MKQPTKKRLLREINLRGAEPINDIVVTCAMPGCGEVVFRSDTHREDVLTYSNGSDVYLCNRCHESMKTWKSKADKEREWIAELEDINGVK